MGTEIITLETLNEIVPADVFKKGGINPILEAIRAEVEGIVPDTTTAKGRNAIASLAHKVAKSKALIDKMGKNLADGLNAQLKPINAERKIAREELNTLKETIRHPLTQWEAEQKRIADEEAARVKAEEKESDHEDGLIMAYKFDRELQDARDEAAKIAKEAHERELEIEAKRIKRFEEEAAENARIKAEAKAKAEIERVEREKREAIEREQIAKEQAEQSKRDQIAAEERAKVQAELAEKDRVAAERQAVINAKNAAKQAKAAEIERQEAEKAASEKAEAERLANREHVSKLRGEAKEALMFWGLTEVTAKKIVMAINDGKIPHVKITY